MISRIVPANRILRFQPSTSNFRIAHPSWQTRLVCSFVWRATLATHHPPVNRAYFFVWHYSLYRAFGARCSTMIDVAIWIVLALAMLPCCFCCEIRRCCCGGSGASKSGGGGSSGADGALDSMDNPIHANTSDVEAGGSGAAAAGSDEGGKKVSDNAVRCCCHLPKHLLMFDCSALLCSTLLHNSMPSG